MHANRYLGSLLVLLSSCFLVAEVASAQQCCAPESLLVMGRESQFVAAPGYNGETRQMRQPVRWSGIPTGLLEGRSLEVIGRPDIWYNRVEGLRIGTLLGAVVDDQLYLKVGGSVNTGLSGSDRWSYRASARYHLEQGTFAALSFHEGVHTRYESALYGPFLNSINRLFGGDDYFDYYRSARLRGVVGHDFTGRPLTFAVSFLNERSSSVPATTDFDLVGNDGTLRDNLGVEANTIRSVGAYLWWGEPTFRPRGLFGEHRVALGAEASSPALMGSDKNFLRLTADIQWEIETFARDQMRPNSLNLRLNAATFMGDLPRHRYGIVDGGMGIYTPFGSMRTLRGAPYEGERHLAFFWEHHFRGLLFEQFGLQWPVEEGLGLAVFGGHGRTWLGFDPQVTNSRADRVPDGFHHELGLSVTGILQVARLDAAVRLDEPGWGLGLSVSRLF